VVVQARLPTNKFITLFLDGGWIVNPNGAALTRGTGTSRGLPDKVEVKTDFCTGKTGKPGDPPVVKSFAPPQIF
jgi:hypothetical protein